MMPFHSYGPTPPSAFTYPAELDGGTWLTRARRALADGHVPGRSSVTFLLTGLGAEQSFALQYPPHWPLTRAGDLIPHLDTLVADLGDVGPSGFVAYDTRLTDRDLGSAFAELRGHQRSQRTADSLRTGCRVLRMLFGLANDHETPSALCASVRLDVDRRTHMLGVFQGHADTAPAGTVAYAAATLEALAFRLARAGRIGSGADERIELGIPGGWPPGGMSVGYPKGPGISLTPRW